MHDKFLGMVREAQIQLRRKINAGLAVRFYRPAPILPSRVARLTARYLG
jgi:hypothetical protein